MKFKCEINDEDIACFAQQSLEYSSIARKHLRASWLAPSTSGFVILLVYGIIERSLALVIVSVLIYLLSIAILRPYVKSSMIKKFIRQAKEMKGILGVHEFAIIDDFFIEQAGGTETKTSIENIDDVCETDLHLFIYINQVSAHIIPKREITKDITEELINLKKKI